MPVLQGFNIDEGSPDMGNWSVKLSPEAPALWRRSAVSGPFTGWLWDTICITPTRLRDPGLTRATVLSKAVYSGMVTDAKCGAANEPWTVSGGSLLGWLGTSDSPSLGPTGFTSAGSVSLATFLASLFTGGTPSGKYVNGMQLYSASTCSTNTITDTAVLGETARELIDRWCRQTTNPTEWWVRPDGQVHFAVQGNSAIFTQTPTVLIGRDVQPGTFGGYQCYKGTSTVQLTSRDWANLAICYDGSTSHDSGLYGSLVGTFDPTMQMMSTGSVASDTHDGGNFSAFYRSDGGAYEAAFLLATRHKQRSGSGEQLRQRSASVDAYCLALHLKPGDFFHLYDPDTYALSRGAPTEIVAGGRMMHAIKVRLADMTWPIKAGMGVYRISNGSGDALDGAGIGEDYGVVTDLTDYVVPEDGPTQLTINTNTPSLRKEVHGFQRREANTASWR